MRRAHHHSRTLFPLRPPPPPHRATLAELAGWALAQGRTVDLDVAAVCLEVLERERVDDGLRLDRASVNGIMWGAIRNEVTILGTTLPDRWLEDLWSALQFCVSTGRLTADSDPEPALLEPLQCYGGLGADGHPRRAIGRPPLRGRVVGLRPCAPGARAAGSVGGLG